MFPHELGVHANPEIAPGLLSGNLFEQGQHGAFNSSRKDRPSNRNHRKSVGNTQQFADRSDDPGYLSQSKAAIFVARGAHADKRNVAQRLRVGQRVQSSSGDDALDDLSEAWLDNWRLPSIEEIDFALIQIHAGHAMATVGEAGSGHTTDVAHSKEGDIHI